MVAGLAVSDIIELALLLIAVGAITGVLAGLFGIGGGAILVPVLYECFRISGVPVEARMPLCVGTSLAIIIPTSIRSFSAHSRRGAADMNVLRLWWFPVIVGVLAGAVVARLAPEQMFKIVFVAVAYCASARLVLVPQGWVLGQDLPGRAMMRIYGAGVGLLSTLMGVGGGLFSNLLLTFYGRPIHQAVATSAGLGVVISITGVIGHIYAGWPSAARFPEVAALQWPLALGNVSLVGAALVMPASSLTAPIGVKLAHAMSRRALEIAFGCFLFLVGTRFLIALVWGH
ncbi:MAG: sulfite exporter TauE/SafE family protein [Alphaproteobacteria bacterium]|nr:sulfite exporter TauE/SafE family protein [Alphaproteobacteria bacterium]